MAECEVIEKFLKKLLFDDPNSTPAPGTSHHEAITLNHNQPQTSHFDPFKSPCHETGSQSNVQAQTSDSLSSSQAFDSKFEKYASDYKLQSHNSISNVNTNDENIVSNKINSKKGNFTSRKHLTKSDYKQNIVDANYSYNLPDEQLSQKLPVTKLINSEKLNLIDSVSSEEKAKIKIKRRREKKKKKKKDDKQQGTNTTQSKTNVPKQRIDSLNENSKKIKNKDESPTNEHFTKEVQRPFLYNKTKVYSITRNKNGRWSFYCEVCYRNVSESDAVRHISLPSHLKNIEHSEADRLLSCLPEPLPAQVLAVDEYVNSQARTQGLSVEEEQVRRNIHARIHNLVSKLLCDCAIESIGSSTSGFGLKTSRLDLVLQVPPKENAADMLSTCYQIILKDKETTDVYNDFKVKIPVIEFKERRRNVKCSIVIDGGSAIQLNKLFSFYSSLDYRVPILGKAFRAWAEGCEINEPEKGTLPSFVFPILLIHFLQQENPPVLPVLQELQEWTESINLESFKAKFHWKSKNKNSVGRLWMKLFHFYAITYQPGVDVISICSLKKASCAEKNWGTKFYAIEDPFVHRNLAHVIPNRSVFQYIYDCFTNTYRYFGFPQLKNREKINVATREPSSNVSSFVNSTCNTSGKSDTMDEMSESVEEIITDSDDNIQDLLDGHDLNIPFESVVATLSKMNLDNTDAVDSSKSSESKEENELSTPQEKSDEPTEESESKTSSSLTSSDWSSGRSPYYWDTGPKDILPDMLLYEARFHVFRGGKSVPLVCRLCQKSGHLKNDCPKEALPEIRPLPPMMSDFLHRISDVCLHIKNENCPTEEELRNRQKDAKCLEYIIRETYPDAILNLFGSFCNGFGFSDSDMDFCLTFHDKDGKDFDHRAIIEVLAEKLKMCRRYRNVSAILGAKVPIVKFYDSQSDLESDISLYNTLAQFNTKLLKTYCEIDNRVQILGYVFKYFAKTLGICDASKGSLSSYAYVLMAIFFLQQRRPPVLPVLQELYIGERPVVNIDGWNAWFFSDLKNLHKVWSDYGSNKESVGSLWVGLLSFYAAEFNMKDHVVCIRQKKPLTRFHKLWNSKKIAIEDPFDLNHNLGSGLSRKMHNFIMKAFIRGREHFGTPVSLEVMNNFNGNGPKGYLFDRQCLNRGQEPPRDRGCRICGKIGHMQKDCPIIQARTRRIKQDKRKPEPNEPQNFPRPQPYKAPVKARGKVPIKPNMPHIKPPMPMNQGPLLPVNRTPPGFTMVPNQYTIPPPGFKHGMMPVFPNGNQQMMVAHQQQQQYQARPATSCPFPMPSRAVSNAMMANNAPCMPKMQLPPQAQQSQASQHWPQPQRLDNRYHLPQSSQAAMQNQQSNFVPLNLRPLFQQQVGPDWARTSSDSGQIHRPF